MSWKRAFHFDNNSNDGLSKKERKKLRKLEGATNSSDSLDTPESTTSPAAKQMRSPLAGPSLPPQLSSPKVQSLTTPNSPQAGPSLPPHRGLRSPSARSDDDGSITVHLSSPTVTPVAGPSLPPSTSPSSSSGSALPPASPSIGPTLPPSALASPSIGPTLPPFLASPSIGPTLPPSSPIGPSPKPSVLSSPKSLSLSAPALPLVHANLSPITRSLNTKLASPSLSGCPAPTHLQVPTVNSRLPLSPLAQYSTPPLSIQTHLATASSLPLSPNAEERRKVVGPAAPPPSNFKDVLKEKEELRAWKDRSLFACDEDFILHTFRKLVADWEEESFGDKVQKRTLASLQEDLKPFIELMKSRGLASSVLEEIQAITMHIYKREYDEAEKIYLNLSIGKDTWPIGIGAANSYEQGKNRGVAFTVGHLLNDMSVAKYIKSIKRLITFAREHFPA